MNLLKNKTQTELQGSTLLLVLMAAVALAALITIGYFSAEQTTQRIGEKGNKAQAQLAIESTMNLIIGYLEDQGRTNQGINATALQTWLNNLPPQNSGNYQVKPGTDVNASALAVDFNSMYALPLKQRYDPNWDQARMQETNVTVSITAHSKTGGNNFVGKFTVDMRGIPPSEFTVFSQDPITGDLTVGESDSGRPHPLIYAAGDGGTITGEKGQSYKLTSTINTSRNARVAGKQENTWSEVRNALDITGDQNLTTSQIGNPSGANPVQGIYKDMTSWSQRANAGIEKETGELENRIEKGSQPGFGTNVGHMTLFSYAQPLTYFGYGMTNLVVLNLADIVQNESTNIMFPGLTNAIYVITNATDLGISNSVRLTFPPNTAAYFVGNVNSAGTTKLAVAGNLGTISPKLALFDPTAATPVQVRETVPDPNNPATTAAWEVTMTTNVSQSMLPFVNNNTFNEAPELENMLLAWANNAQSATLNNPKSPYYLPNGSQYYLPIQIVGLNNSVHGIPTTIADYAYQKDTRVITNSVLNYNFAGWFSLASCNNSTVEGGILNTFENSDSLPKMGNVFNLNFSKSATVTTTNGMANTQRRFVNPDIIDLVNNTTISTMASNYWTAALINAWTPNNHFTATQIPSSMTAAQLTSLQFYAQTWITINPDPIAPLEPNGAYFEHFTEYRTNYVESPNMNYQTLKDTIGNIPATDMRGSQTWQNFVWNTFVSIVTNSITPGDDPIFNPPSFENRYQDGIDKQIGGWKHTFTTVATPIYNSTVTAATEASTDPKSSGGMKLSYRTITFHYKPIGWTVNVPQTSTNNLTPMVLNGRWIVNQKLNTLSADDIVSAQINGQLTIKNRPDVSGTSTNPNDHQIGHLTVIHNENLIPNEPDRIYDFRITHSSITPVN